MAKLYFIKIKDASERGPYTEGQLKGLWERAEITADAYYYCEGMNDWESLLEMMEKSEEPFATAEKQPSKPLPRALPPTPSPSATASNKDDVLFTDNLFTVTRNRFVTPGQTYSMRNITSVKYTKSTPNYLVAIGLTLLVIFGLLIFLLFFVSSGSDFGWMIFFGITVIGGCIGHIIYALRRPTFGVCLITTAGEVSALESKDGEYTSKIVSALNKAISQH